MHNTFDGLTELRGYLSLEKRNTAQGSLRFCVYHCDLQSVLINCDSCMYINQLNQSLYGCIL